MMAYVLALLASMLSFDSFGGARHERSLAGLYALSESAAMMVEVTGSDPVAPSRKVAMVLHDGDAPLQLEPGWTRPAQEYRVFVDRPAVVAADHDACAATAREIWYVACHEGVKGRDAAPICLALEILGICCITDDASNPDRCEAEKAKR